jgi:hypothetical protein
MARKLPYILGQRGIIVGEYFNLILDLNFIIVLNLLFKYIFFV